ncbi:hypothetical protein K488DRAFT_77582 [Vararia minispora EC-137]|uniref:Uncharacterized protein n=1 Tax=Vararia minispora EC-137 TaxID=1314806 RepID=A0ACB8QPZ3_9AGAM|nr:hypothetical protein K488DRAFT_77582 [Vararia minispora EC-137]
MPLSPYMHAHWHISSPRQQQQRPEQHVESASELTKPKPARDPPIGSSTQRRALEIYRDAVRHEAASELDLALRLYRQAFKLDSDVDRTYMQAEGGKSHAKKPSDTHARRRSAGKVAVDGIAGGMDAVKISTDVGAHQADINIDLTLPGALANLVEKFPDALQFSPEVENESVPLKMLPDELLVLMLSYLEPSTIERFAIVSKKARVLTLDPGLWRPLVQAIYKPPQISGDEGIDDILTLYDADYRRTYIEHPRVRLDGVYIAVNQYIRPGLSENRWVNVSHLITYHRYLRFYPTGQVISLLANEDQEPQQIISVLKPSLRMKGFYIGTWRLEGTTVYVANLADPAVLDARHTFQMTLQLRSRPLGRWNRLDFREYESVNVEDGEVLPLPLKKERPFWFSKVRSYAHA